MIRGVMETVWKEWCVGSCASLTAGSDRKKVRRKQHILAHSTRLIGEWWGAGDKGDHLTEEQTKIHDRIEFSEKYQQANSENFSYFCEPG